MTRIVSSAFGGERREKISLLVLFVDDTLYKISINGKQEGGQGVTPSNTSLTFEFLASHPIEKH